MFIYILKFSACLGIFIGFYKLFLEKESMHQFKRYYLITALILAIGFPLVTFTYYVEAAAMTEHIPEIIQGYNTLSMGAQTGTLTDYLSIILWSIYGAGVLLFGIKFVYNLSGIYTRIKQNPKHKSNVFTNVLLTDLIAPHTFFNYIFFNKQKFEAHEIPQEVFWHEQTHAQQKHSLDILFVEVLQILLWFNPLLYYIKQSIKLNHEFLADQAVINKGATPTAYQLILLAFSSNAQEPQLANAINYSSIKKRFTVMKTQTSKQGIWLRSLVLLPLLALMLYGFSEKAVIEKNTEQNNDIEQVKKDKNTGKLLKSPLLSSNHQVTDKKPTTTKKRQQKATTKQVAEYNKLAKHYNSLPENRKLIIWKDVERMKYLYQLMSADQRKNAESFPKFPPPPPAPKKPKVIEIREVPAPTAAPKPKTAPQPVKVKRYKSKDGNEVKLREVIEIKEVKKPRVNTTATPVKVEVKRLKTKDGKLLKAKVLPEVVELPGPEKSPLDFVIEIAKKDAKFIYKGKTISSDEAITLLKKHPKMNINAKKSTTNQTIVYISKKPILIGEEGKQ